MARVRRDMLTNTATADAAIARYRDMLGLSYAPSAHQVGIFDWVTAGDGNAVVDSVAGSGKTTALECAVRLYAQVHGGEVMAVAFNREIAEVLGQRLHGTSAKTTTAHAHGLACVNFYCYARMGLNGAVKVEVDKSERKYPAMFTAAGDAILARLRTVAASVGVDEMRFDAALETGSTDEIWSRVFAAAGSGVTMCGRPLTSDQLASIVGDGFPVSECTELAKLARLFLLDFDGAGYERGLDLLARRYDVDVDETMWPLVVIAVQNALRHGCTSPSRGQWLIDFTDMIWLPTVVGMRPKQYDLVMVDECQDISTAARKLLIASVRRGGRMMWVGDRCQPVGTMVQTPSGEVPIESIKAGDMVVSADIGSSSFIKGGKRVLGVTARPFDGDLVRVESEGKVTRYTPNHRCVVRFSGLRGKWCVYLQRRGDQYRIGKAAMDYAHASGPVYRARCENADAMWILRIYDTEREAWIDEQALSGRFGIPQLRFTDLAGSQVMTQDVIDTVWSRIGDNSLRGESLLTHIGQDPRYPLFDFATHEHRFAKGRNHTGQSSLKRPIVVRACNLIDGVELLHYEGRAHYRASQWRPCTVTRERYAGPVYSMDVEKYELYVADGLLTHNCQAINGFAGADSNSFDAIVRETRAQILPLSVCYRCPTLHLARAREWRPDIQARPGAPAGTIRTLQRIDYVDEAARGDLVICRRTAPLIGLCFELIAAGTSATVRGRADMSKGLIKIIERASKRLRADDWQGGFTIRLGELEAAEVEKIRARARDEQAAETAVEALNDRMECVRTIHRSSGAKSKADLTKAVERIFEGHDAAVVLSTVHRAKGLEADRVVILEHDRLISPRATQAWQREQEENGCYVAWTRSKRDVIAIPAPKRGEP